MTALHSHKLKAGIRYRLISQIRKPQIIKVHHSLGGLDHILLPTDAFGRFIFAPMEHDVKIGAPNLKVRPLRSFPWRWSKLKNEDFSILKKSRFAAPLRYGGCIYALERPAKGAPRQSLADNRGMDLGSESLATLLSSQMILDAVPTLPDRNAPAPRFDGTIAVVLHLHYPDLWSEFSTFLKHSKIKCRLIVTLTTSNPELTAQIQVEFPGTVVRVVKNLGRDVRPFMAILQSGLLDDVDLICKLHGKRSVLSGTTGALFGHLWRRRAFLDLLGSAPQVQDIFNSFQKRPRLGMMGPATLRLRRGDGIDPGFEQSFPVRECLAKKIGFDPNNIKDDFFAGTMFWVRREAIERLKTLFLEDNAYTQETDQTGDQFEHGLERFFSDCVRGQGYHLADIEPLTLVDRNIPLRSKRGRLLAPRALFQAPRAMYRSRWAKPLPHDLSGRKVALVTSYESLMRLKDEGWLTCYCATQSSPNAIPPIATDALFLREIGGFDTALFADALRTAPALWDADELQLISNDGETLFLPRTALCNPELRAHFTDALVWNKESETRHRYGAKLKSFLEETSGMKDE